jgi:hypothetical protein
MEAAQPQHEEQKQSTDGRGRGSESRCAIFRCFCFFPWERFCADAMSCSHATIVDFATLGDHLVLRVPKLTLPLFVPTSMRG